MESNNTRSYLGIGSCAIFVLGTFAVMAIYLGGPFSPNKSPGIELLIILPLGIAMYSVGLFFAVRGLRNEHRNPLSLGGLALNVSAIAIFCLLFVFMSAGLF